MQVKTDTAADFVRLIGETEAIRLMEAFPKLIIKIPVNPEKAEKLKQVLQWESVVALCEYYHGETIYVPDAARITRKDRDRRICEQYGKKSVRQLAREYRLSERWIKQIRADGGCTKDESQMGLF